MQIRSDDIQLYYDVAGTGFPIVLLHPFPVNHEFWAPVAPKLSTDGGSSRIGRIDCGSAALFKNGEDERSS